MANRTVPQRDHDRDEPETANYYRETANYYRGPGRRRRSVDAVIEAYADGAIDRPCSHRNAKPLEFCRHPNGATRKIPCTNR